VCVCACVYVCLHARGNTPQYIVELFLQKIYHIYFFHNTEWRLHNIMEPPLCIVEHSDIFCAKKSSILWSVSTFFWQKTYHTCCNTLQHSATLCNTLQHTATHCNTLHHTATHCNTLQHTATHYKSTHYHQKLTHVFVGGLLNSCPATHCNTLQNTATHCNTL